MKKEQKPSITIISDRKNQIKDLDITEVRRRTFQSIDALFQLLSAEAITHQSFSDSSAQTIFDHATNVILYEQRLASFAPQIHLQLTLLDSIHNPTYIAEYVLQVVTISRILDIVSQEIDISSTYYSTAQRLIDRDVYVPESFDQSNSDTIIAELTPQLQLQALAALAE